MQTPLFLYSLHTKLPQSCMCCLLLVSASFPSSLSFFEHVFYFVCVLVHTWAYLGAESQTLLLCKSSNSWLLNFWDISSALMRPFVWGHFLSLILMCMVFRLHVYLPFARVLGAVRGWISSGGWSYRQLWTAVWVLRTELESFGGADSGINHWAISPAPYPFFDRNFQNLLSTELILAGHGGARL